MKTVLVARCENYREDVDAPCTGRIRYHWGQIEAPCDTCGARCGIAVADWERVEQPYGPATVVDVIAEEINETLGMKVSFSQLSGIAHRAAARLRREGLLVPDLTCLQEGCSDSV